MNTEETRFEVDDEAGTDRLGRALADVLPDGTTVGLCGTLGAGKTRLVKAIAMACGIERENVVSPTFVLCQEYHGRRSLYHLDTYRLADEDEFLQLGPEEYFDSTGITLVEWADRVVDCLPADRIDIHIEILDDTRRMFRIVGSGGLGSSVSALRKRLAQADPPS